MQSFRLNLYQTNFLDHKVEPRGLTYSPYISPDRPPAIRKIILNVESDISFLVELLRPIVLEWG
jgi:hypothetical protein